MGDDGHALRELLRARNAGDEADHGAIDEQIKARFCRQSAVLITDMDGFSRTTKSKGIIAFLAMIQRQIDLCRPGIRDHGGQLLKVIGDDLFCAFPDAPAAVNAALAMQAAVAEDNETRAEDDRLGVAIGIGFGELLHVGDEDLFGDQVNRASKLGEDIATGGEILITEEVAAAITDLPGCWMDHRKARISGLSFDYYAVMPLN